MITAAQLPSSQWPCEVRTAARTSAEEGFFFSVLFYNFPSLRCIFRQGCEYIGSSIGVKDLAINPKNDSVSGISVGSFK